MASPDGSNRTGGGGDRPLDVSNRRSHHYRCFARVLLTKPKVVFLDEATSALDEGLEFMLYDMVRRELPDTVLVSVTHRSTVGQHHEQHLELLGGGQWRLGRVEGKEETEDAPVPV